MVLGFKESFATHSEVVALDSYISFLIRGVVLALACCTSPINLLLLGNCSLLHEILDLNNCTIQKDAMQIYVLCYSVGIGASLIV